MDGALDPGRPEHGDQAHPAAPLLRAQLRPDPRRPGAARRRPGLHLRGARRARQPPGPPDHRLRPERGRPRRDPAPALHDALRVPPGDPQDGRHLRPDRPEPARGPRAVHRRGLRPVPHADLRRVRGPGRGRARRRRRRRPDRRAARGGARAPPGRPPRGRPHVLHHLHLGLDRPPQGRRGRALEHLQLHRDRARGLRRPLRGPRLPGHDHRVRLLHRGDLADLGRGRLPGGRPHRRRPPGTGARRVPAAHGDLRALLRADRPGHPRARPAPHPQHPGGRRGLPRRPRGAVVHPPSAGCSTPTAPPRAP